MRSFLDAFALTNGLYIMPFRLVTVDPAVDFPELVRCMLESYEEPDQTLYRLFCPILGKGPDARTEALAEHAERMLDWHQSDPDSHWQKVVDGATGRIVAAALWKIHRENPFGGHDDHAAYWYPEGGQRDFVTQAIGLFDTPREKLCSRPHLYLNIIFTHPRHRHRGAADLMVNWGIAKAEELGLEMWLDAFPPARQFYPRYGFALVCENDIRPKHDSPDADWKRLEEELLPLTTWPMWRPKGGPFVEGESTRPWEATSQSN